MFYMPLEIRMLRFLALIGFNANEMMKAMPEARSNGQRCRGRSSKRRTWSKKKYTIKLRRKKIAKKSKQINRRKAA